MHPLTYVHHGRFHFLCSAPAPHLHSFPTRRSSDLIGTSLPSRAASANTRPGLLPLPLSLSGSTPTARIIAATSEIGKHTSELQSRFDLVCRLLLEKKNTCAQAHAALYSLRTLCAPC